MLEKFDTIYQKTKKRCLELEEQISDGKTIVNIDTHNKNNPVLSEEELIKLIKSKIQAIDEDLLTAEELEPIKQKLENFLDKNLEKSDSLLALRYRKLRATRNAMWKEFEECQTMEAKYAKALDKIEALIHLLSVGYIAREDNAEAETTAQYANKAVAEFPQLRPVLDVIKDRLRKEFAKQGFEWRSYYDEY